MSRLSLAGFLGKRTLVEAVILSAAKNDSSPFASSLNPPSERRDTHQGVATGPHDDVDVVKYAQMGNLMNFDNRMEEQGFISVL